MAKCVVCNKDFELIKENRYTSRNEGRTGISAIAGGSEETLYDTFDCPHCGCQNIMQERKRDCSKAGVGIIDVEDLLENLDKEEVQDGEDQ
jgi:DNA-directed RNA polymerase subunit RPC12/RpoP